VKPEPVESATRPASPGQLTDLLCADLARPVTSDSEGLDPRLEALARDDGYREANLCVPDLEQPTGWLCPRCGRNATVFYGPGPRWDSHRRRYIGPDRRLCLDCFRMSEELDL
jgi:hypothetical protein